MAELSKKTIKEFGGFEYESGNWVFEFPNGYTASVINYGYGGGHDLFEILVFETESQQNVSDAEGWFDEEKIRHRLSRTRGRKPVRTKRKSAASRRPQVRVRRSTRRVR